MNSAVIITIIICMTILTIAAINAAVKVVTARSQQHSASQPGSQATSEERWASTSSPAAGRHDPDAAPPRSFEDGLPLPVDPENRPTVKVYQPRPGSTQPPPRCVCHQYAIEPGEKVLWWPMPGSEEVRVFCQRGDIP